MNWDYLAGFIDGEGSLCISRHQRGGVIRYMAHLNVGNTNKRVLDSVREFLGVNGIEVTICKQKLSS